jgi:hypothetical protein
MAMTGGGEYGLYDLSAVARHLGADMALWAEALLGVTH